SYEPGPSHVGVYIGGGNFIHASSAAGEVTVTPLSKPYYAARYLGARRVTR
ncbi:MAG TPA: glycoside hydrolase, partial [Firmicutes bacterium]|nr:glycoside hydrolase [Bacillota bacterium]